LKQLIEERTSSKTPLIVQTPSKIAQNSKRKTQKYFFWLLTFEF
jgi:hypothetical protein